VSIASFFVGRKTLRQHLFVLAGKATTTTKAPKSGLTLVFHCVANARAMAAQLTYFNT
jgi:hypothetical protein